MSFKIPSRPFKKILSEVLSRGTFSALCGKKEDSIMTKKSDPL
jgi:hypothetical protein